MINNNNRYLYYHFVFDSVIVIWYPMISQIWSRHWPGKIGRLCPRCWDWWLCCSGEECDDLPSSRYPGLWISQDSFPSPSIWNEIQQMYKRVGLELLKIVTKSGEIIKRSTLHTLQVRMFCLCSFHLNIIEVLPTPAGPRNTTLERVKKII